MAEILSGITAAASLNERTKERSEALRKGGVVPCLRVMRVGENGSDLAYEASLKRTAEGVGVQVDVRAYPESVTEEELIREIEEANADSGVHGILVFRPLHGIDEMKVLNHISAEKDMDGVTEASMNGVYSGSGVGYPPCTADAVMRMIDFYGYDLTGKKVTVIGRSLVVGKPLAMMLLKKNATVTVCHTKTADLPEMTKMADIVVSCAGHIGTVGAEHVREGQAVFDVGVNFTPDGKMCGDVLFDEVEPIAAALTPVPKGVGSVTSAILMSHVLDSAEKNL